MKVTLLWTMEAHHLSRSAPTRQIKMRPASVEAVNAVRFEGINIPA